eukprot:1164074-Amphidinium_carterae.1
MHANTHRIGRKRATWLLKALRANELWDGSRRSCFTIDETSICGIQQMCLKFTAQIKSHLTLPAATRYHSLMLQRLLAKALAKAPAVTAVAGYPRMMGWLW